MAESLLVEEAPSFVEDVASSVIVEPGPAAAAIGTLPSAFADLTESGSESGDEVIGVQPQQQPSSQQQENSSSEAGQNTPAARSSPPPNCAICLSRCKRKCFTDSCRHQFCFKCLCEWSKIKPECPLCKQPFKTIIHNVRTLEDFDRYPVQSSPPEHSALSFHIVNIRQRYMLQNQAVMTNDIDGTGADESQDGVVHLPSRMNAPLNRFEPYRMELLNFYRHEQESGFPGSLSQLWRRYVYDRKLYSLPVSDSLTGNFREWSARFYRDNPAQMHRLMPWINRDIVCLLRNSQQSVTEVMQLMHNILPMINIPTRTFRRRLFPFLGERTNHFIHELFNFARSPYDMVGYDRVVQYSARAAEEVEVDLLDLVSTNEGGVPLEPEASPNASGGNGREANGSAEFSADWSRLPRPSTSVIVTNPSATHSFSVTMATDGSELPGISIRRTTTSNVGSQTVAINLSMRRPANEVIEIDDGDAAANAEVAAINDGSNQTGRRQAGATLPISAHIELESSDCSNSSDDDDECVFVLERKPPHLRTPELVSLDSNSDSDVVFVDEQRTSPPKAAVGDGAEQATDAASAAASSLASELFMGPSTSGGVCSTSGKNWKRILEQAGRHDLMHLRSLRSKRNVTRAQQNRCLPTTPSSVSSEATHYTSTSDSSSNSEDCNVGNPRRKRRALRKPQPRKRAANVKAPTQLSKRRRKHVAEPNDKDAGKESSSDSSSSSSSGDSSEDEAGAFVVSCEATGNNSNKNNANESKNNNKSGGSSSSSSSSDDDSTENLFLSTLRATLKSELVASRSSEERKPMKRELESVTRTAEETLQQQLQVEAEAEEEDQHRLLDMVANESSAAKRRRSSSSSNMSSHSNSVTTSTLASHCTATTMSSCSALSLFNTNADANVAPPQPLSLVDDIANTLMELCGSGGSGAGAGADGAGYFNEGADDAICFLRNPVAGVDSGRLFNEQPEGVEDAISFLRNVLPSASSVSGDDDEDADDDEDVVDDDAEAQLGIYSDASNELRHYQAATEPEVTIDVVGMSSSRVEEEFADDNEDDEQENQPDEDEEEQQEEQQHVEDNEDDYDEEDNDEDDDAEDAAEAVAAASDSDLTDSDQDATTDAY